MADKVANGSKGGAPITRHPLFPAIVALWFGALFGLGSLAIRPSLIEQAVLAAHIDTIIPAAAPPLGMTSRIFLALVLATIGSVAGAALARILGRPKVEKRERRRMGAGSTQVPEATTRFDARANGAFEDDDPDEGMPATTRRRALAIQEDDHVPLELREFAPLPGGRPQILNVSDVDLGSDAPSDGFVAAPATPPVQQVDDPIFAPPSHQDVTASPVAQDEPQPMTTPLTTPMTTSSPAFVAPPVEAPAPQFAPEPQRAFAPPVAAEPAPEAAIRETAIPQTAVHEQSLQPSAMADDAPRSFDPPTTIPSFSAALQETPIGEPTRRLSLPGFEPSAISPIEFSRPFAAPEPEPFDAPLDLQPAPPPLPAPGPAATPVPTPAHTPPSAEARPRLDIPTGSAAAVLVQSELDDLSSLQLIERLALSIQRRRLQAASAAPAAPVPAPSPAPMPEPAQFAAPSVPAEPALAQFPAPPPLPAALRPLVLDHEIEDDLPGYVPPRRIAMPAPASTVHEPAPYAAPAPAFAHAPPATATEEEVDDESRTLEEGYSSLLNLSRQGGARAPSGRIEVLEPRDEQVEPVVIFPGQATRAPDAGAPFRPFAQPAPAPAPPAPPAPVIAPEEPIDPSVRRFDAPATSVEDREEAERALRAALSTLQRMSGAA